MISEYPWFIEAEPQPGLLQVEKWDRWIRKGYLKSDAPPKKFSESGIEIIPDPSLPSPPPSYGIPITTGGKPYHLLHLENFFDAIRGQTKLTCPAEVGYETAVAVLKVNEAAEAGHKLEFKPEDFVV